MQRRNRIRETATDILLEVKKVAVDPPEGGRKGPTETYQHLCSLKEFKGREDEIGSEKRVGRLINDLLEKVTPKDSPFEWHRMEEFGLPWEASGFIMQMLGEAYRAMPRGVSVVTGNSLITEILTEDRNREGPAWPNFFPPVFISFPTFREVIWWWRVREAAPEIAQQVGVLSDIRWLADFFTLREIAHELFNLPLVTADLEACLALKPWLSEDRHSDYHEMVDFEVVLPVPWGGLYPFMEELPEEIARSTPFLHAVNMEHPELLCSQQSDMNKAAWSGGRLSYSLDTGLQDSTGPPAG
jgi:hypothetical protein